METQPGFNLITAIEAWRSELATQSTLTEEARRELETHLRDTFSEMQKRGLNDEESFWLARRRLGKPSELREEFVKANPVMIWRERVFWIAVGLFAIHIWSMSVRFLWDLVTPSPFPYSGLEFARLNRFKGLALYSFTWLSLALIAVLIAQGRLSALLMAWSRFLRSRKTFVFIASSAFLAVQCSEIVLQAIRAYQAGLNTSNYFNLFYLEPIVLIAVAAWLLPCAERERPEVLESHSSN